MGMSVYVKKLESGWSGAIMMMFEVYRKKKLIKRKRNERENGRGIKREREWRKIGCTCFNQTGKMMRAGTRTVQYKVVLRGAGWRGGGRERGSRRRWVRCSGTVG